MDGTRKISVQRSRLAISVYLGYTIFLYITQIETNYPKNYEIF